MREKWVANIYFLILVFVFLIFCKNKIFFTILELRLIVFQVLSAPTFDINEWTIWQLPKSEDFPLVAGCSISPTTSMLRDGSWDKAKSTCQNAFFVSVFVNTVSDILGSSYPTDILIFLIVLLFCIFGRHAAYCRDLSLCETHWLIKMGTASHD